MARCPRRLRRGCGIARFDHQAVALDLEIKQARPRRRKCAADRRNIGGVSHAEEAPAATRPADFPPMGAGPARRGQHGVDFGGRDARRKALAVFPSSAKCSPTSGQSAASSDVRMAAAMSGFARSSNAPARRRSVERVTSQLCARIS